MDRLHVFDVIEILRECGKYISPFQLLSCFGVIHKGCSHFGVGRGLATMRTKTDRGEGVVSWKWTSFSEQFFSTRRAGVYKSFGRHFLSEKYRDRRNR